MAEFLDEKRREIGVRLKELKPLVGEYSRLQAAVDALDGVPAAAVPRRSAKGRAPMPTKRRREAAAPTKGRGRPKGTGTRSTDALALVKATPGITIPEIAGKMGIKPNYLYRVLRGLAADGLVTKNGQGWHPKDAA